MQEAEGQCRSITLATSHHTHSTAMSILFPGDQPMTCLTSEPPVIRNLMIKTEIGKKKRGRGCDGENQKETAVKMNRILEGDTLFTIRSTGS